MYYSLLFLPPASRTALIALHALRRELDDIADECADPGVARLKFAWWQEELANMFQGRARHPVTLLLAPAVRRLALPRDALHELLKAAEARLPPLRYARFDDLLEHARRTGGAVAALVADALGGEPATARTLGTALELAELLYDLGLHARRDRLPLPLEELARFNVPVADILHGKENAAFRRLMAFEAGRAETLLRESLQALTPEDRRALLPCASRRASRWRPLPPRAGKVIRCCNNARHSCRCACFGSPGALNTPTDISIRNAHA